MRLLIDGQTLATPEIDRGIGVVFKRLCEQLVPSAADIEWYVAVRAEEDLRHFSAQVRALVKPVLMGRALEAKGVAQQTAAYTEILQRAVRRHGLDAYWTPNPLMHHVLLPTELRGLLVFATIYDLIPLVLRAECLDAWPEAIRAEYLRRVQRLPAWADRLVFISEHSRRDYERFEPQVAARAEVVPLAVDHSRFWPHACPAADRERYVLYIGGFDCPRKNMGRALEAFALLVRMGEEFRGLTFRVVCSYTAPQRSEFLRRAERLGVGGQVRLEGYVDDESLAELYRRAAVFFFPSVYEGFGLPVLEAMACGLPVVATRVSSLPEVAGEVAYYCSATDPHDMARALAQALRESGGPFCRRAAALARAALFRWEETAAGYARLFRNVKRTRLHIASGISRPRVAHVVSSFPSAYGLHGESAPMLSCMQRHAEVTVYVPGAAHGAALGQAFAAKPLAQLPADYKGMDAVLYHVGKAGEEDASIRTLARQYPGILVLHELAVRPRPSTPLCDALVPAGTSRGTCHPAADAASEHVSVAHGGATNSTWESACALAGHSRATIVCSRWAREQLPGVERVFVVPHVQLSCTPPAAAALCDLRQQFGLREDSFVLGAFGNLDAARLDLTLRAVERLVRDGFPIQLLLEVDRENLPLRARFGAEAHLPANSIVCTGALDAELLLAAVDLCDVVLHVRCPGGAAIPLPLAASFHLAKASLVSHERQFAELPHSACWKVERNAYELPQLVAYVEALLQNPAARRQLGENARFFAQTYATCEVAAGLYLDVVHRVAAADCRPQAA